MNTIKKLLKTFDSVGVFNSKLPAIEQKMLNELLLLLKDLEVKNGRIVSNLANLKLINGIRNKLERLIVSKPYLKDLTNFINSFNTAALYASVYFKEVSDMFKPQPYYDEILNVSKNNAIEALTRDGISYYVASPIRDKLLTAVTSSQNYASLLTSLQKSIVSSKDNLGLLSKYASTYSTTALSQFVGQYIAAINKELSFTWFRYVGSNIKTTREFCLLMTEKEWVHESEFETVLAGNIDGHQVAINESTKLPHGLIAGTVASNFVANCGGWNCRHKLFPVADYVVPEHIRQRVAAKN